jgi:hypothetical protein
MALVLSYRWNYDSAELVRSETELETQPKMQPKILHETQLLNQPAIQRTPDRAAPTDPAIVPHNLKQSQIASIISSKNRQITITHNTAMYPMQCDGLGFGWNWTLEFVGIYDTEAIDIEYFY